MFKTFKRNFCITSEGKKFNYFNITETKRENRRVRGMITKLLRLLIPNVRNPSDYTFPMVETYTVDLMNLHFPILFILGTVPHSALLLLSQQINVSKCAFYFFIISQLLNQQPIPQGPPK